MTFFCKMRFPEWRLLKKYICRIVYVEGENILTVNYEHYPFAHARRDTVGSDAEVGAHMQSTDPRNVQHRPVRADHCEQNQKGNTHFRPNGLTKWKMQLENEPSAKFRTEQTRSEATKRFFFFHTLFFPLVEFVGHKRKNVSTSDRVSIQS